MSAFLPDNLPPLGTDVWDCHDPRHVGRLDSIQYRAWANITWRDTGWHSTIPLHRLCWEGQRRAA